MIRWLLRILFGCAHGWKVLVERELPSLAEELVKNGERLQSLYDSDDKMKAAKKKVFSVVCCDKCGAIRVVEVSNA